MRVASLKKNAPVTLFVLLCIVFVISTPLPEGVVSAKIHVDKGFEYTLNHYMDYGLEFGRDFILMPYGPLGYLLKPFTVKNHLAEASIFHLLLSVMLIIGLAISARRQKSLLKPSLVIIALSLSIHYAVSFKNTLVVATLIYYIEDLLKPRSILFLAPLFLAVFMVFVKLSTAVILIAMFFVYLIFTIFIKRDALWITAFKVLLPLLFLWVFQSHLFSSLNNFWLYIQRNLWAIADYSQAQSIQPKTEELSIAIIILACLMPICLLLVHNKKGMLGLFWLTQTLLCSYFAFKHGFVRADWHIEYYFSFMPAMLSTLTFFLPLKQILTPLLILTLFSAHGTNIQRDPLNPLNRLINISRNQLSMFVSPIEYYTSKKKAHEENMKLEYLPEEFIKTIANHSVEIMPFDFHRLNGTGLRWQPAPVIPYYTGHNQKLDHLNRDHYRSEDAAQFIVLGWQDLDGKHPLFSVPETYNTILNQYAFVQIKDNLILLKRAQLKKMVQVPAGSATGEWSKKIPIPSSDHIIIAKIKIRHTPMGRLLKSIYQLPPVIISLYGKDGADRHFRVIPGHLESGLWVSNLPFNIKELGQVFKRRGLHDDPIETKEFHISYRSNLHEFEDIFEVEFFELKLEDNN